MAGGSHGQRGQRDRDVERATCARARGVVEQTGRALAAHASRVAELAVLVADSLELDHEQRRDVEVTALLHDVGKAAMPREILDKPSGLSDAEWQVMQTHTIEGERLVQELDDVPAGIGRMVRASHERWDGCGYPDGLRGTSIPLAARVVFAADAFDAMTSRRPYREAMDTRRAVAEIRRAAGRQFDPVVAEALAVCVERPGGYSGRSAAVSASGAPMA
jgi:HD-GYP domain-containing protein (c-di-GMP phosphodiesterase class II)